MDVKGADCWCGRSVDNPAAAIAGPFAVCVVIAPIDRLRLGEVQESVLGGHPYPAHASRMAAPLSDTVRTVGVSPAVATDSMDGGIVMDRQVQQERLKTPNDHQRT